MELVLSGMNLLLLLALWNFVIKKTLIDNTRDKLFDLRDRVRQTHIKNSWSLDSQPYHNLRNLLNSYLRYTESYSVWKIVLLRVELSKEDRTELRQYLVSRFDAKFNALDSTHAAYIRDVRKQAFEIITEFSVLGSGLLLCITALCMPFLLVHELVSIFKKGISTAVRMLIYDLGHLNTTFRKLWKLSRNRVAFVFVDITSFDVAISDQGLSTARAC